MKRLAAATALALALLLPGQLWAGFSETLPKGVFMLDIGLVRSSINSAWKNDGTLGPLIDPLERFEPGGSKQGTITPDVEAKYTVLVNTIQYGLFDSLTLAVGIPVVLETDVRPGLSWEEGDYQWTLGRPYSEEDFWAWAWSMGQPKPGDWTGNRGVLTDMIIGFRWRPTDYLSWFRKVGLASALTVLYAVPTGTPADPEEVVSAGTTAWNLHFQGELGFHLGIDKFFPKALDNRLILGADLFYEIFFKHEYDTPSGVKNPLLLNDAPYAGPTYTVDPGDFIGASFQVDVVPFKGPALATWLSGGSVERAKELPPMVTLTFRYTHIHIGQSDWTSESPLWDWEDQEENWRPGYKNIIQLMASVSLLRVGVPLTPYVMYRNQTWLPGKNFRAANVIATGVRIPLKFW